MGKYEGLKDEWDRFKERKENIEKVIDAIPKEQPPPDDMYNIPGTPIWVTPNEPVEPGDCDRWPASCENVLDPLSPNDARDLSPGLDFESSYSNCSICVTITPNLGGISFPPYTICRIAPECEEPYVEPPPDPVFEDNSGFHPPSPEPMEWQVMPEERLIWFYLDGAVSQQFDTLFNDDGTPFDRRQEEYTLSSNVNLNNYTFVRYHSNNTLTILNPPFYGYLYGYNDGSTYVVRVPAFWKLKTFIKNYENGNWNQAIPYFELPDGSTRNVYWNPIDQLQGGTTMTNGNEPNTIIFRRKFRTSIAVPIDPYHVKYYQVLRTVYFRLRPSELPVDNQQPTPTPIPTPIPTPSPQIMATCCDLASVLKELRIIRKQLDRCETVLAPQEFYKIKNRSGIASIVQALAQIPPLATLGDPIAEIPKRFMYPLATGQHKVNNYAQLIEALMRQIDRNNGASSWEVEVKDSDPSTPGDQTLPIQVHSINDALKAMFQFMIDQVSDKNSPQKIILENVLHNQKGIVHLAYDLASTKKLAYHNNCYLSNIEGYLDYHVKKEEHKVTFAIDPTLNNAYLDTWKNDKVIKNLFQVKDHKIVITKDIDKVNLSETLGQISRNAAIAASPHVHRYKPGIVDKLVDAAQLGIELGNTALLVDIKKSLGIMSKDEMKDWREDAERAYIPSGGNLEDSREVLGNTEERYYGHKKPAIVKDTTKRSRRRNRRSK